MGRPLRWDTIEAMGIETSKGQLSKQVGYNKYRIKDDDETIVRLAEVEDGNDVVVTATIGDKELTVLKIMKHLIQTTDGAYEYTLNEEGKAIDKDGNEIFGGEDANPQPEPTPTPQPEPEPEPEPTPTPQPEPEPEPEPAGE